MKYIRTFLFVYFDLNNKTFFSLLFALLFSSTLFAQELSENTESEYSIRNADILYRQSRALVRIDSDSAIQIGKRIMDISYAIDYKIGIAKAKETIARAHMHNKSISKSLELAKDAFDYAKKIGADSILLETINILGASNYRLKKIHKTYEYNTMGRTYAKQFGNLDKQYLFTMNAAYIMVDLNNFKKAVSLFEEAEKLLKKASFDLSYAQFYFEVASAHRSRQDIASAQKYLEKAKTSLSQKDEATIKIDILILEASLLLEQNNTAAAKGVLTIVDSLILESNNLKSIIDLSLLKSKIKLEQKNYSAAETYIDSSLPLAEKISYIRGKESLLGLLYRIKQAQGDFKNANIILQAYTKLTDSINFKDNQNQLKILLAENNFAKEQEILKIKLQEAKTNQNYIIIIAVLVVMALISIVYLIKRNSNSLRRLNQQLEYKTARLNDANMTKNKLFSIIGHDLKAPITNFKSLFDMLVENQINEDEFDVFLPKMKGKIDHILFSLNNLLSWGMTQLKGESINPKKFELNKNILNAIKLLSDNISDKQITIINTVEQKVRVLADENHVQIVLQNLLSNAIKFTPKGGKICIDSVKQGEWWNISIKDTGVGMPKHTQRRIFVENKQVSTRGTDNEAGTGLGLSICIEMILKNKGKIWVESDGTKGTTICFSLPSFNDRY